MMKSITLNLLLIVALSAGLAASVIAQTAPAVNPAAATNPAPTENPVAVAPNANAPAVMLAGLTSLGTELGITQITPAQFQSQHPAPADIPATSSWSGSSAVGPGHGHGGGKLGGHGGGKLGGHGGGKLGGHAGTGHLGNMHVGKAGGLKEHSRNAGGIKAPEERANLNESR